MDEKAFNAVYPGVERRIEKGFALIKKEALPENYAALKQFDDALIAKGNSPHRRLTYMNRVGKFARLLKKPFKEVKAEELKAIVAQRRKIESAWSIHTYGATLRSFYRWLYDLEKDDRLPATIAWFNEPMPKNTLRKEDLLDDKEVSEIIACAPTLTLKTLFSVAYETGCRPGELLSLRGRDVVLNGGEIAKLYVSGKTRKHGGERTVFVVRSLSLLKQQLDTLKGPDGFLFEKRRGQPYGPADYNHALERAATKAGIKKEINPYLLRHSRATELYRDAGEQIAKKLLGHTPDSKMARTYCHLNDEDAERAILEINGLKEAEATKKEETRCPSCKSPSYYGEKVCKKCGLPLTQDAAFKVEGLQKELLEIFSSEEFRAALRNPEVRRGLIEMAKNKM